MNNMETKMKANQKRPIAGKSGKSLVGKARYEQISCAMDQYKNAMKDGYYIEAIALMESAICDRMESTLNYLYPCTDFSYGTIGRLADNLIKTKCFSQKLLSDIKNWAKKRNDAIHQMVKLLPDNDKSFKERYIELKQCAEDGLRLFRRLDNEKQKLTRYQNSHPIVFKLKNPTNNTLNYPEILKIKCKVTDLQKSQDNILYDQTTVFEAENGTLWKKELLDLYYDRIE